MIARRIVNRGLESRQFISGEPICIRVGVRYNIAGMNDQIGGEWKPVNRINKPFQARKRLDPYLLSEIARKNGGKVEARSWLPVGLRRDTYFGISLTSQEE